jgi:beta-xylosidase
VTFGLHADRTAFSGLAGERIVEPGEIVVAVGGSSDCLLLSASLTLTGPERVAGPGRVLDTPVSLRDAD